MLSVSNLTLQFGKRVLFDEVNLKFTRGNCYGVIGANGAGKSSFLKILSGELSANYGGVELEPGNRMAVLKQNHFEYEEEQVLETVIMGHKELYDIGQEKNAIYMDPEATEEDGLRAAELETQYGEMGGWTADSDAAELLSLMGISEDLHYKMMKELSGPQKVKVLLAQALFGEPDLLLLDEPTNDLDPETVHWLADFLADFRNTVIVVSHDRYFLDMVCTHIVDIDFGKIRQFTGNYSFWYQSSQLMLKQMQDKNKKVEQKRKELSEFIQRFAANAAKSRQATSRKKALEKLNLEEMVPSSRKYPFINFDPEREPGGNILSIEGLKAVGIDGNVLFNNITFDVQKGDKIVIVSRKSAAITAFLDILSGESEAAGGKFSYGSTITTEYLPNENEKYFSGDQNLDLVNWLWQYSDDPENDETFIRGFLGRMLFSGEEVFKKSSVLSGGEKMRCMMSKMMLAKPNFLLLDEPTNHLDLESIQALNKALQEFPGNLIMTSHDHELVRSTCNRIIEISPNGMIDRLMPYDEYFSSEKIKALREQLHGTLV